ncbi:MAG: polysaccharide deacetylase family protein [Xylanivirga thermophila]|jgi:peptidoglycan-N-acetylglucosamine deacetylase
MKWGYNMKYIYTLIFLSILFLIYCFLPSIWARNISNTVLRQGDNDKKQIALTFDDGPSPKYTPKLLDLLDDSNIKATFFLVGKRAAANKDIVNDIKERGHVIGCHSNTHKHAWLMLPHETYNDMLTTFNTLSNITGEQPHWYRPPWGTFNLVSLNAARRLNLKPAYWCIEAQDWDNRSTVEHIYSTVIDKAAPGSIVVLHDNGGDPGAPENTLKALPVIIDALKKDGFEFVTLDELIAERKEAFLYEVNSTNYN